MRDKQAGEITGIYQATSRGFGFVTPEDGKSREDDWFIPPRSDGGAWHGDQVRIQPLEEEGEGRRRSARVTVVTGRANKTVAGILSRHNRELWLQPDNDKLPGPIQVLTKRRNVRAGDRAAVAMTSFGSAKLPPMGTLREVFGPAGERESAVAAILYQNDISRDFPDAVLAEAQAAPQAVEEAALAGRLDLRDKIIITIDGAASKDLDDAVSLEKDGRGRWVLGVHIADVSHYVTQGSALDLEAWERGTSVYFADQVVPMLPRELSNGICSLNPRVDRLALSCNMTMDASGEGLAHQIAKTVIRSTERMTYDDCNVLLRDGSPELAERYAHILPMLRDMAALAKVLERRPGPGPLQPSGEEESQLRQWPVQIKLAPVNAPWFDGCDLLIAADCTAYAYGAFHRDFIRGKVTLIGCPKLDEGDYTEKLTAILAGNDVKSVTVARMTVPCCGGIQRAAEAAVSASGKQIPLHVAVISPDGAVTART